MQIRRIVTGDIEENAYVLSDGNQAFVVDPGADHARIKAAMQGLPCAAVLLTHAHYDHIGAAAEFGREGAKIYLHEDDRKLLNGRGNLAAMFGQTLDMFTPDVWLKDGDTIPLGNETVRVLSTPGHTDGSVCYILGDTVFSGDTLFYKSVGRTDFPSGDARKLQESLRKLLMFPDTFRFLPGHGEQTDAATERKYNPYIA